MKKLRRNLTIKTKNTFNFFSKNVIIFYIGMIVFVGDENMRLSDITEDGKISFQVKIQDEEKEFQLEYKYCKDNALFTDVIRYNDKVVGFNGNGLSVDLIYFRQESLPVVWKSVTCKTVSVNGEVLYKIKAASEGFELNRRTTFRVFVGAEGTSQIGINKKALDVTVKDVSETGFAFVSNEDMDVNFPCPVRLVFSDLNENFVLIGVVVRKVTVDDGKIIYGCRLSQVNNKLSRYINEKQRKSIAMSKNDFSYAQKKNIIDKMNDYEKQDFINELKNLELGEICVENSDVDFGSSDEEIEKHIDNVDINTRRNMFKHDKEGGEKFEK